MFIWLGTNAGVTNTVDTDCVGSDISEYANTYTGDYGRIIKTLVDNGNKVILCQIFAGGGATGVSTSNLAIKALATRFECKCIELSSADITALQDSKLHTNEYGDVDVTHFSCMGYSYVANFFSNRANAIALSDPAYFCIRKGQS